MIEFGLTAKKIDDIHSASMRGQRIQMFDLEFKKEIQADERFIINFNTIEQQNGMAQEKITLINHLDHNGMFVAQITNHQRMSVDDYIEMTGFDPILHYCSQKKEGEVINYEDYLKRTRNRLGE